VNSDVDRDGDGAADPVPDAAERDVDKDPDKNPDLAKSLLAQARAAASTGKARQRRYRRGRRHRSDTQLSGAGPDDRDPQPVAESVDRLVDDRGWSQALAVGGVEGRWPEIVGAEVATHCAPETFEAGRLTVRTDSTAWAAEIRLLTPTLLARLNDDLGAGTVTHLQVVGPKGPSWKKGRLRVKGRGPRDTYG
jgi:predicted nucleic acid-binding Zn ribbon protein